MRWYGGAFAAVALLVVIVVADPFMALGVLALAGLVALYALKPKFGAGFSVVGILFGSGLATSTDIEVLGYLDEALILLPFVCFTAQRLLKNQPPRWLPGLGWIAAYIAVGSISSIVNEVPTLLALQSTFLILKGFAFAFAVAQLDWTSGDVRKMVKPAAAVLVIVMLLSVVNLAIPQVWSGIFSRRAGGVDYRLGLPSLIGPFDHEFAYGQFMALSSIAVLAFRQNVAKGVVSAMLLAGSFIGLILSFRRKAIAAALTAMVPAWFSTPHKKVGSALALVAAVPIAAFVGWEAVSSIVDATYNEYFLDPTRTARTRLTSDGFVLAAESFPLGVGFARFGSFMASQVYSPVYVELGYNLVYGLAPGDRGPYLSDTFWPAIAGEAGFIGMAAFLMALVVMARQGSRLIKASDDPHNRWAGVVLLAWVVEFVVESVAAPVFSSPPVFTLLFGVAGLVTSLLAQQPAPLDPAPPLARKRLALR